MAVGLLFNGLLACVNLPALKVQPDCTLTEGGKFVRCLIGFCCRFPLLFVWLLHSILAKCLMKAYLFSNSQRAFWPLDGISISIVPSWPHPLLDAGGWHYIVCILGYIKAFNGVIRAPISRWF